MIRFIRRILGLPAWKNNLPWDQECERRAKMFGWDADELAFQKAAFDIEPMRVEIIRLQRIK